MRKELVVLAAMAFAALFSMEANGETGKQSAPPVAAVDHGVSHALNIALENRPSVAQPDSAKPASTPDDVASNGKPASTLDDYAQARWLIKLNTIVPYIFIATPIILLIVLVTIRLSGVKSPEHVMLAAALVLVIQATLTVSLTAEGSDSLSASMGILGAIAGYLFGRSRQESPPAQSSSEREPTRPPEKHSDTPDLTVVRPSA